MNQTQADSLVRLLGMPSYEELSRAVGASIAAAAA